MLLNLDTTILVGWFVGYNAERHPPSDHSTKVSTELVIQEKNFFYEILIGSYAKLSLAEALGW